VGRFVRPETVTLTLEDGARVIVRRRLNTGQQTARMVRMYAAGVDDPGKLTVKVFEVGRATVLAYLLDWTLTDDDGDVVPIRGISGDELEAVLDALAPDAFREVREAIEAHEARETAAREQEKKTIRPGVTA
jgi:hypothetical protein